MPVDELVRVCSSARDDDAWAEIVRRFQRPISLSIIRTAYRWGYAPKDVADDLIQDTYLKLCADGCRLLAEFAAQHPEAVTAYVKTIAVNLAHDHFKRMHSQKRGSGRPDEELEDAEACVSRRGGQTESAIERNVLLAQVNRHLDACATGPDGERDREIFWLYYRQGMSAKSIAALPMFGLTRKGVESVIFRLTKYLRQRIEDSNDRKSNFEKGSHASESY